jgi:hypothetical protein
MQRFLTWLLVGMLFTAGGHSLLCQTVKLLADVDVKDLYWSYQATESADGRYVANVINQVGLVRVRTYPIEKRDTIPLPDSAYDVQCIGFLPDRLLLSYLSANSWLVRLATISNDGTVWQGIPDIVPPTNSSGWKLQRYGRCIIAPGRMTAALDYVYASSESPSRSTAHTVVINSATLDTLHSYDSVSNFKVCPGGREYYFVKRAADKTGYLHIYVDASTGQTLRSVYYERGFYGAYPSGIDSVMYLDFDVFRIDGITCQMFPLDRLNVGCLAGPNVLCTVKSSTRPKRVEAYDVLDRSVALIDTINASEVYARVNDVDQIVAVHTTAPFRYRVYSYSGWVGREGLACVRTVDTTLLFNLVAYGVVSFTRSNPAEIVCMIDNKEYGMNGRRSSIILRADHLGTIPFSASARSVDGSLLSATTCRPLVVRYPGSFTVATRVNHVIAELALSADEQSIHAISDSMSTIIPLTGVLAPVFDSTQFVVVRDSSMHVSQCPLLSSRAYVDVKLHGIDTTGQGPRRSVQQHIRWIDGKSEQLRSIDVAPDVVVKKARTLWSTADSVIGLHIQQPAPANGRLYLSKLNPNGDWVPYGDSGGIEVPYYDRIDISVRGRIAVTYPNGLLVVMNKVDATKYTEVDVGGWTNALYVDDTTIVTPVAVWKHQATTWEQRKYPSDLSSASDIVRLSGSATLLLRTERTLFGFVVDHVSPTKVDSLKNGYDKPSCVVYSQRYHGLFVGYSSGVLAFLPLDLPSSDPTSVAVRPLFPESGGITSCVLYTMDGSMVAGMECAASLSATDVQSLHIPNGLYLAVYMRERGVPTTQMILVAE